MTTETSTDRHWGTRAKSVEHDHEVNLMDVFQRELEFDEIIKDLDKDMTVLEVGCGNGFSTDRFRPLVRHIDAFDKSEEMVERARRTYGETKNRFFADDVTSPRVVNRQYDCVICVRVLINLPGRNAQVAALRNMAGFVRSGGVLLLAEGFTEGFGRLSELRKEVGLPPLEPASINHYSPWRSLEPIVNESFEVERTWHLGVYDYLTRVVYPLMAGPENVRHNTNFSERSQALTRAFNPYAFADLSRMRGFVLRKRSTQP